MYVVAFVAMLLESCAESVIFKPPNPCIVAIMSVPCKPIARILILIFIDNSIF